MLCGFFSPPAADRREVDMDTGANHSSFSISIFEGKITKLNVSLFCDSFILYQDFCFYISKQFIITSAQIGDLYIRLIVHLYSYIHVGYVCVG